MTRRQILNYCMAIMLFMLFVVERAIAVHYIPSDTKIGTWNSVRRTYTLTSDVSDSIEIEENNLTLDGDVYTIYGSGFGTGIYNPGHAGITILNVNVDGFELGIRLYASDNCIITDSTVSNNNIGVFIGYFSDSCSVINSTVTKNNNSGIGIVRSENCTVTGNTTSDHNNSGIYVLMSVNCTVRDNTVSKNSDRGIDTVGAYNLTIADNNISNSDYGIVAGYSSNSTMTGNTVSNNELGIFNTGSHNCIISGNMVSNNSRGIYFSDSNYSTLTGNIVSNNNVGISVTGTDNTLTSNMVSYNDVGLHIHYSTGCQTYNNNFISNTVHCNIDSSNSSDCIFNLQAPTGGNFWSDWTSPDADGDGFVDSPFVFEGGQDYLPWTVKDGWITPQVRIEQLVTKVESLNLQQGISNSLDSKLDAVEKALDDVNENNDGAAVNALGAFINAVNAQRGDKISEEDADSLIVAAQQIIDLLTNG